MAEFIGRAFPAYQDYAKELLAGFDMKPAAGPYPDDILSHKSKAMVEYRTPAGKDGLGAVAPLQKSEWPTEGLAILLGKPPSLLQVAIRLPRDARGLASAITGQFKRDAARMSAARP